MPYAALAMTATPPFLNEVVALVVASALIAYVCHRFNVQPIVGFLLAGVILGPHALGAVKNQVLIESVAEIGVVLLLFTLGIEFSLERLGRIRRAIFVGGGLQLTLTIAATTLILLALGINWRSGVYTGSLIALSSTAIVLKVMDRSSNNRKGEIAIGMLIFQDLAIVALVLVLPMLSGATVSLLALAKQLGLAALIVVLIVIVARRLMPKVLEFVARTCAPEIFLLSVIAICLGTAWITSLAGVSLSLGAFLAGLVVSESRFSHHAFSEIMPLQMLFSAVFFVSVGLLLDLRFVLANPLLIVGIVAATIVLKVITTGVSALALGSGIGIATGTGLLLAQIGEFSFVLERVGRTAGLHPAGMAERGAQTFIAAAVILMVLTPFLARGGEALERRIGTETPAPDEPVHAKPVAMEDHVIVAGYGASARPLTRVLRDSGIPHVILTLSPTGATEAERDGSRVILGDYARRQILELGNIFEAKMLVIPDDEPDVARRVTAVARQLNPKLQIVVRTRQGAEVQPLLDHGADQVLAEELEIGLQLFSRVLAGYKVVPETQAGAEAFAAAAELLLDSSVRKVALTEKQRQACEHAASVPVEAGSSATGCIDCLRTGDDWVHLRICMTCGGVRCCDSSKNRHATKHWEAAQHPVMKAFDQGETWGWCYPDKKEL
ncbi:MAG TPA: cation:proton antiporter [Thermoanaerobaculia bacterium]